MNKFMTTIDQKLTADMAEFAATVPTEWAACGAACLEFEQAKEPTLAYEGNTLAEQRFRLQSMTDAVEVAALATEIAKNEVIAADPRHILRFSHRQGMVGAQRKVHAAVRMVISKGKEFAQAKLEALNASLEAFYSTLDEPAPKDTPMNARYRRFQNTFCQWELQINQQEVASAHLFVSIGNFPSIFVPQGFEPKPRYESSLDKVRRTATMVTVDQARRDSSEIERRNKERDARVKDGNSRVNARARKAVPARKENEDAFASDETVT
jgi:hypothetical protein